MRAIEVILVSGLLFLLASVALPGLRLMRGGESQATCLNNLFAQGQALGMYKDDHDGWFPGGIMATEGGGPYIEYGHTFVQFLPYFGYQGDPTRLWARPIAQRNRLAEVEEYQCPSHPNPNSLTDYVSNALPIPMRRRNETPDASDSVFYIGTRRLSESIELGLNARRLIYISESHPRLTEDVTQPDEYTLRSHAFFLGQHLPLDLYPRIAATRHSDGTNNLFFDGAAATLTGPQVDPGPELSYRKRLFRFTQYPLGNANPTDPPQGEFTIGLP